MSIISEILFSDPTFVGQFGGALLHAVLWVVISDLDLGLMGIVERWVKSRHWYSSVQKNYKDDPAQEIYKYDDPGDNFISFLKTALHHGWGGTLMLLGMVTGQTWLWRHGMLTEVGGLDIMDFLMIFHCKLWPPGRRPYYENLKGDMYLRLAVFHHSVGLCVGIPVNMYFADIFQFQLFGLVILGGPALTCWVSVFLKTFDAEEHKSFDLFNQVQMAVIFCFLQRTVYYFPAAWSCVQEVWQNPACGWFMTVLFVYALVSMSLFNLIVLGIMSSSLYKAVLSKTPEDRAEGRRRFYRSTSMGLSASDFNIGLMHSKQFTHLFVASRMVALAGQAKKRVNKKNS